MRSCRGLIQIREAAASRSPQACHFSETVTGVKEATCSHLRWTFKGQREEDFPDDTAFLSLLGSVRQPQRRKRRGASRLRRLAELRGSVVERGGKTPKGRRHRFPLARLANENQETPQSGVAAAAVQDASRPFGHPPPPQKPVVPKA